jgi:hypothetical protein
MHSTGKLQEASPELQTAGRRGFVYPDPYRRSLHGVGWNSAWWWLAVGIAIVPKMSDHPRIPFLDPGCALPELTQDFPKGIVILW